MNLKLKRLLIKEYNMQVKNTPDFSKITLRIHQKEEFIKKFPPKMLNLRSLFQNLSLGAISIFALVVGTITYLNTVLTPNGTSNTQLPATIEIQSTDLIIKKSIVHPEKDGAETLYNSEAISLIVDEEGRTNAINRYGVEYAGDITSLMDELLANTETFDEYALIISPFVFSSSELPISLENVLAKTSDNTITLTFSLYSPEEYDMDINLQFFGIRISKDYLLNLNLNNLVLNFTIHNLRNGSSTSAYYN